MGIDVLREYCLAKAGTTEGLPFGPTTLVFKVMGKMFALSSLDEPEGRVNLKCDPERSVELRERYEGIIPGWHMNKVHWNTVYLELDVEPELIRELVDHSYETVVSKLPKKLREELETST
jgi:predicted DNA-binding protein (MmcQ/YjbR family)